MASTACCGKSFNGGPSLSSVPSLNGKALVPISFLPLPYAFKHNFDYSSFKVEIPRSGIFERRRTPAKHLFRVPIISCLVEDESGVYSESKEPSESSSDSPEGAAIDIKLPRRSLLLTFTCNVCGARSQKFVNRLAYERGTVFVQCSGCFRHHKLVDNLGLVVEYDFREEINDPNADQH